MTVNIRKFGLAAAVAAALMAAGCSGSSDTVALVGPDPVTLSLTGTTANGLTATLAQDKSTIPVTTGTVHYTLTLANGTAAAVDVTHPADAQGNPLPPVTLTLTDGSGGTVYQSAPSGASKTDTIQPQGFLSETLTLPGALQVIGRYQATAVFATGGGTTTLGPLTITAR